MKQRIKKIFICDNVKQVWSTLGCRGKWKGHIIFLLLDTFFMEKLEGYCQNLPQLSFLLNKIDATDIVSMSHTTNSHLLDEMRLGYICELPPIQGETGDGGSTHPFLFVLITPSKTCIRCQLCVTCELHTTGITRSLLQRKLSLWEKYIHSVSIRKGRVETPWNKLHGVQGRKGNESYIQLGFRKRFMERVPSELFWRQIEFWWDLEK